VFRVPSVDLDLDAEAIFFCSPYLFVTMPRSVDLVVGNTYQKLLESKAKLNRKGTLKKVHDWVLYVDIIQGDHNLIEKVQFEMDKSWRTRTFTCSSPIKATLRDGSKVMRFKTRQQSTGSIVAKLKILGRGGTTLVKDHPISLQLHGRRQRPERFIEASRPLNLLKPQRIPDRDFGIELELSCAQGSSVDQVAGVIREGSGANVTVIEGHARAHDPVQGWKLVHDGSIVCSRDFPNCSRFELVSPILCGETGLSECSRVIHSLQGVAVSVNKSMGFHVHISVQDMGASSLKKICQNFCKYEDVIDTFMPPSRRSGSSESNQYFKSNKTAIGDRNKSNLERNRIIAACGTTSEVCHAMNPSGRYYKLNLQNLATGRQPTIEFRQHSGTSNFEKISAWVRLCMAIATNSARFKEPSALKNSRTLEEQFEMLFEYVIKDRALRDTFQRRQTRVLGEDAQAEACCDGCSHGRACDSHRLRN
jgi:hypothetical protein